MTGRSRSKAPQVEGQRRDRLIQEREHDTYKLRSKLPDPTVCPRCRATYRDGRWTWEAAPADAHEAVCPACHRIADRYPGGTLVLAGDFLRDHRDEMLGLARNVEERERAHHPLKRIIEIDEGGEEVCITTTDPHLARGIGDAVERAYGGELSYTYTEESNELRLSWRR
jgi:NMD protein affecting ribosome stability and mRNA decay